MLAFSVLRPEQALAALAAEWNLFLFFLGLNLISGLADAAGFFAKIGDPDPLQAIGNELQSGQRYDAIVLSTLPQGISRWLRRDVVSRVRREFPSIRVEHVVSELPATAAT